MFISTRMHSNCDQQGAVGAYRSPMADTGTNAQMGRETVPGPSYWIWTVLVAPGTGISSGDGNQQEKPSGLPEIDPQRQGGERPLPAEPEILFHFEPLDEDLHLPGNLGKIQPRQLECFTTVC